MKSPFSHPLLLLLAATALASAAMPCNAADWRHADVRIELRPRFVARTAQVVLGDVAVIHTADLHAIQRLLDLPLGTAPPAGAEAWLTRETVARWLRVQLGVLRDDVQWKGADEVQIIGANAARAGNSATDSASRVNRGDWVSLGTISGEVRIESRAQALGDGLAGQVVSVRTASVANPIAARVVGPGRVEALP